MRSEQWDSVPRKYERLYQKDIYAILKKYFTTPTRARILSAAEWLDAYARQAAERMVTGLYVANMRTWRQAAREGMRGREIYEALQDELRGPVGERFRELVAENAELIRSLPLEISQKVTARTAKLAMEGNRASVINRMMANYTGHLAGWHSRLIARTETSKASTALTESRSESMNLPFYIWRSSEDARVRASHRFMARNGGVICRWNDPPSPEALIGIRSTLGHYHPGNCPNCRCYPEVMLRFDQVRWPHRMYIDGRVQMIALARFRNLVHTESIAA